MSYVPSTGRQREEMLRAIGMESYDELYRDVPEQARLQRPLDLPAAMSELEVTRAVSAMASIVRLISSSLMPSGRSSGRSSSISCGTSRYSAR